MIVQASSAVGTLMRLCTIEDTIPLQKEYTNFFSVDLWTPNWLATILCSADLASLYRTIATCICSGICAQTVMSWRLKTHSINLHNLSNNLHIWKFSLHSPLENSFKTTLSYQSLLLIHIQHVREALGSREGTKWSIEEFALLAHSRTIWWCSLPSDNTIPTRDSMHLIWGREKKQNKNKKVKCTELKSCPIYCLTRYQFATS